MYGANFTHQKNDNFSEMEKQLDIKLINGNEIIDFLNKQSAADNEDLCDISISSNSFVFEKQEVKKNTYTLHFTASYNNWGTDQEIPDNSIQITKRGVTFFLQEPFEGDGSEEALEKVLTEWLKTHKFDMYSNERFFALLSDVYEQLPCISFDNKNELQQIINKLTKAHTYMK